MSAESIAYALICINIATLLWGFRQYWKRIQAEEAIESLFQFATDKKLNFQNYTIYRQGQEPEVHNDPTSGVAP